MVEVDPFWKATTAEELEEEGEGGGDRNAARNCIDKVGWRLAYALLVPALPTHFLC